MDSSASTPRPPSRKCAAPAKSRSTSLTECREADLKGLGYEEGLRSNQAGCGSIAHGDPRAYNCPGPAAALCLGAATRGAQTERLRLSRLWFHGFAGRVCREIFRPAGL